MGNIYIIDDDEAVRDSLSFLLETHGYQPHRFETGDAFLQTDLTKIQGTVLLDVRMPGRDGLEVLKLALKRNASLQIIMMSGHGDIAMAVRALKNGAQDFIEKPFQVADILSILNKLKNAPRDQPLISKEKMQAQKSLAKLTARETEVAAYLVDGRPNKIIAHELAISIRTVETHRAHIMTKLGIRSLSELVRLSLSAE